MRVPTAPADQGPVGGGPPSPRIAPVIGPHDILDRDQSRAAGKGARQRTPLESLGEYAPGPDRDPIGLLIEQNAARVPDLVPVRHGRMMVSPFTFYRGAALPMAGDLATGPSSGLWTQLCGDAHLSNFGAFGSPERRLVFDMNDFDETLPGPFEWDVKRLLASLAVAGRSNGFSSKERRQVLLAAASGYRISIREFAETPMLQVWYAHFDVQEMFEASQARMSKQATRYARSQIERAHDQDHLRAVGKLTTIENGRRRIISHPPLIVRGEDLRHDIDIQVAYASLMTLLTQYAETLPLDRRSLLRHYRIADVARKVVGVGSVGTEAWILLMEPLDGLEPLLLQAKQAGESVLARYLQPSQFDNHGRRVVNGQRLMQAVSDVFLGWQRTDVAQFRTHDYYVRQLRDWKYSVEIDLLDPTQLARYGRVCGWTLARAHARTGNRIAIAAYLGGKPTFDETMAEFAEVYADQTERDHAAMVTAVESGRIEALSGV